MRGKHSDGQPRIECRFSPVVQAEADSYRCRCKLPDGIQDRCHKFQTNRIDGKIFCGRQVEADNYRCLYKLLDGIQALSRI